MAITENLGKPDAWRLINQLPKDETLPLRKRASAINVENTLAIVDEAVKFEEGSKSEDSSTLKPVPETMLTVLSEASVQERSNWHELGVHAVQQGQVAVVLLAGGMGTRLGYSGPKGAYDFGLKSRRTLFQLHAERLLKLQLLHKTVSIPWYILVSRENQVPTQQFFESHSFFGLQRQQVVFFLQQEMPCITIDKPHAFLAKSYTEIATSPDGNGGVFGALHTQGCLADMKSKGVDHMHVIGVDNCLVMPADPVFIGYCIAKQATCGAKVVPKQYPSEAVGIFCEKEHRLRVVEYSEMSPKLAEGRNTKGQLLFNAANIVNHYFSRQFIETSIAPRLNDPSFMPYHIARKKVPYINEHGELINHMTLPNAIKLERLIFDVYMYVDNMQDIALLQVDREEEFAPIKNAPGTPQDSPDTARDLYYKRCIRWLQKNSIEIDQSNSSICDISPLVSYSGEGLEALQNKKITLPLNIESLSQVLTTNL